MQVTPSDVGKLGHRYRDAYRVGYFTVAVGNTVQVVGGVIAALILLPSLFIATQTRTSTQALAVAGPGGLGGVLTFALFWIISILIRAHGQVLIATLDTALYNCPFLDERQKLVAVLGQASSASGDSTSTSSRIDTATAARRSVRTCTSCNSSNDGDAKICANCGKKL